MTAGPLPISDAEVKAIAYQCHPETSRTPNVGAKDETRRKKAIGQKRHDLERRFALRSPSLKWKVNMVELNPLSNPCLITTRARADCDSR